MRAALINSSGVVQNIIIVGDGYSPPNDLALVESETAQIGDVYEGFEFVRPPAPAASADALLAHLNRAHDAHLAKVWTFNVGTVESPINLTTRLDDRGQAAMLQLQAWAMFMAQPGDTMPYSNIDNSSAAITKEQALSLASQAGAAKIASFAMLNAKSADIRSEPPTITTFDQIDTIAW